jgi:hypothetical protein
LLLFRRAIRRWFAELIFHPLSRFPFRFLFPELPNIEPGTPALFSGKREKNGEFRQ